MLCTLLNVLICNAMLCCSCGKSCMLFHVCMCIMCTCIQIFSNSPYIQKELKDTRQSKMDTQQELEKQTERLKVCMYMYICMYIHMCNHMRSTSLSVTVIFFSNSLAKRSTVYTKEAIYTVHNVIHSFTATLKVIQFTLLYSHFQLQW